MKLLISLLLLSCSAFSQGAAVPPPIVQITSKPGGAAGPTRPYASGRAAVDVVGLAAATGLPQTWMIEMHPTFASIEDLDKALSAVTRGRQPSDSFGQPQDDLAAPPRTMIAVLQPGWSYRPEEAIRGLPKARYIRVTIHRIRAGLEAEFGELVKLRKLTNDSVNLDRPELAYHVISGEPSGTYILLSPLNSLRVMDEGVIDVPAYAAPAADALAKAEPKAADIEISREHLLFRVEPRLSYVSDDFAAGDPAFWRSKPAGQ
jgi:hypothetical protein